MFERREDIDALLGQAEETASLEFKSGLFFVGFGRDPAKRAELIKDVTGFANAGGGTLIYGVSERQQDGQSVADAIEPVPVGAMSRDQLTQIIHANTDPPLVGFRINTFEADGGQIIVVDIDEGYTATQNKFDYLFYQRVEATNVRMGGYAIRDVMNRRTSAKLEAGIVMRLGHRDATLQNYSVAPFLKNVGAVTARHWKFLVQLPARLHHALGSQAHLLVYPRAEVNIAGQAYAQYEYSSERGPGGRTLRLLPGEEMSLVANIGFADVSVQVNSEIGGYLLQNRPPLRWTLHVDNVQPATGEVPYDAWCKW